MKIKKYLDVSPVFAINSAYENLIAGVNQSLKEDGLNLLQGLVLTSLFFEDGEEVSPSDLAKVLKTTRSNISHIVSSLEYRNLIKRTLHPKDARQYILSLRPDGRRKALSLIKFFDKLQNDCEKTLGKTTCEDVARGIHKLTI